MAGIFRAMDAAAPAVAVVVANFAEPRLINFYGGERMLAPV